MTSLESRGLPIRRNCGLISPVSVPNTRLGRHTGARPLRLTAQSGADSFAGRPLASARRLSEHELQMVGDPLDPFAAEGGEHTQVDLRQQIVAVLLDRADVIAANAVAVLPFSADGALDSADWKHAGRLLVRLLGFAVRDGRVDPRGSFLADLHHVICKCVSPVERLFTYAYLVERTVLDDLATDEDIGATSKAWTLVAQFIRRASFDVLAAYYERVQSEPGESMLIDRLTTLHTRPLFDTALAKEADRAGRFGVPLSIILFDVDDLSRINEEHGYGVGDRMLERLGILIHGFFRQHDWIARYSDDAIAVVLANTDAAYGAELAESVRATVAERLEFIDHRSDQQARVTLSAAVVNVRTRVGDVVDPGQLMAAAEAAVERAKRLGRNRIERVDLTGTRPAAAT